MQIMLLTPPKPSTSGIECYNNSLRSKICPFTEDVAQQWLSNSNMHDGSDTGSQLLGDHSTGRIISLSLQNEMVDFVAQPMHDDRVASRQRSPGILSIESFTCVP